MSRLCVLVRWGSKRASGRLRLGVRRHGVRPSVPRSVPTGRRWLSCSRGGHDVGKRVARFKTTRLPSVQTRLRTVRGVEEAQGVLEELASQVQHEASTAEAIARRLAPRTARDLARALASTSGTDGVTPGAAGAVEVARPSRRSLQLLALSSCVPFLGFGFVDNAVMICAGDIIETQMLKVLTISTLAAAGLGNLLSDVAGVGLGGMIETMAARLGFEAPPLTRAQMQLSISRWSVHIGSAVGVAIGCLLGMFPLLLLSRDEEKLHELAYHHGDAAESELVHGHRRGHHAHGSEAARLVAHPDAPPSPRLALAALCAAARGLEAFLLLTPAPGGSSTTSAERDDAGSDTGTGAGISGARFYEYHPATHRFFTVELPSVFTATRGAAGVAGAGAGGVGDGTGEASANSSEDAEDAEQLPPSEQLQVCAASDPALLKAVAAVEADASLAGRGATLPDGRIVVPVTGRNGAVVGVLAVRGSPPRLPIEERVRRAEVAAVQLSLLAATSTMAGGALDGTVRRLLKVSRGALAHAEAGMSGAALA